MIVKEVIDILEELAPLPYAEDFDNVGLLVGDMQTEVSGVLVTLDTLEKVVDEAILKKCNLIVSFHPIIFNGLKKLNGANYVERVVIKAIQHNIAIYSMHTALDNSHRGVNAKICEILGLKTPSILIPRKGTIKKLTTYVPKSNENALKQALFDAGAGNIGNYSHCSFATQGVGSFKPNSDANPVKGKIGATHYEEESQINITYPKANETKILKALFNNHPYEEVAYEIQTLENINQNIGMGMVGYLDKPMSEADFFAFIKKKMNVSCIRHSEFLGRDIRKVAVLGGSGSFAISAAKATNADIFITADLKYHQFYEAEGKILLADIGHYETEQFTKNLIVDFLTKKIANFAISLSESKTNPIKYF
ncbi:dinuclear metal center protein, YbgI/SA1388 family [Arenibacter nanhaiticus]|uniref:GTP cyclohydrolase 1 type 2 homolog n=1 Tax=Arenibacter nanhaiticus TaxID=558155 RepID=A0A1M6HYT9_9FLAO|nr:Nif3-like dinuclear metal center hexameric protein [Arenibacter nanhaiticus]SHJ27376.1 dinuclear metal center protein, YbgI/SA1388 family [Arenibacter nanhaiticus]